MPLSFPNSSNLGDFPTHDYSRILHDENSKTLVDDHSIGTEVNPSIPSNSGPFETLPSDHLPLETPPPSSQHTNSNSSSVAQPNSTSSKSYCSPVDEPTTMSPPSLVAPPTIPSHMELNTHPMLTCGKSSAGFTSFNCLHQCHSL